ncbi:MAG: hypothetical protein OEM91_14175, partial [Hyphomicrobiales bacterium]|nr:hypothetical protein [Hyphomicrobiales bacterium]
PVVAPDEDNARQLPEMENGAVSTAGPADPVTNAAPAADIPAVSPSNNAMASDVISADSFEQPDDLKLGELDAPKTAALFI